MTGEPTEMAGVADAETEAAYAWALDDDPDKVPTQPIRLTSRRITALSLAASLVLIAVAGAVATDLSTFFPPSCETIPDARKMIPQA